MKAAPLILISIILSAFPLAFSNDVEQVLDSRGNPIFPGRQYTIWPAIRGPGGGGVRLGKTGNSQCPVTVIQDYLSAWDVIPVQFIIKGTSTLEIYTGTPLEIVSVGVPDCASSGNWTVFVDNAIQKAFVGIGGPLDHPAQQTFEGTFNIQKYRFGYKFVYCIAGLPTCFDVGRYSHDHSEGGWRLILTQDEPYDYHFAELVASDSKIKSVV